MLFINQKESFTSEILDSISRFANGNAYVAFTVLITLLSAGLLYVAIKKEKIDKKFFPLLWFFLITNFFFSAIISLVTLPLKKEAETVNQEYESLRVAIEDLEEVATLEQKNINYLLDENQKLRATLLRFKNSRKKNSKKGKSKNTKPQIDLKIPEEPKLLKTETKLWEVQQEVLKMDSIRFQRSPETINRKKIKKNKDETKNKIP